MCTVVLKDLTSSGVIVVSWMAMAGHLACLTLTHRLTDSLLLTTDSSSHRGEETLPPPPPQDHNTTPTLDRLLVTKTTAAELNWYSTRITTTTSIKQFLCLPLVPYKRRSLPIRKKDNFGIFLNLVQVICGCLCKKLLWEEIKLML